MPMNHNARHQGRRAALVGATLMACALAAGTGAMPAAAATPASPVAPPTADMQAATGLALAYVNAVRSGDAAAAARLEQPGRSPTVWDWFQAQGDELTATLRMPHCSDSGQRPTIAATDVHPAVIGPVVHCLVTAGEPADFVLVLVPATVDSDVVTGWRVSHPLLLPDADRDAPDPRRGGCVTDTTPLNIRGGPGTDWPNLAAIPVGDCELELSETVAVAAATGRPWRYVRWHGAEGWVSDLFVEGHEYFHPAAWDVVKDAAIPAMCSHPASVLTDGEDLRVPEGAGYFALDPGRMTIIDSPDGRLHAVVADCNAGGVGWPNVVLFFTERGEYLASTFLDGSTAEDDVVPVGWRAAYATVGAASPARGGVLGVSGDGDTLIAELAVEMPGDASCCPTGSLQITVRPHRGHVELVDIVWLGWLDER